MGGLETHTVKTILVTGAEGFVGLNLMQHLKQKGYDVVAGVRNRARKLTLEKRFGKALVCEGSDAINVARVIASIRPDGVIHLGMTSNPQDAVQEPLTAYQSIVSGTANILDGVRRTNPRARVLVVSSCDVYGNAGTSGQPLKESTPSQPVSTFGSLRATAEEIAHTFFRSYHLNVVIARPFHHTGPGQSETSFFGSIAKQLVDWDEAARGNEFKVADLDCRRDVCHVQDVVEAYEKLLLEGNPNEVYNVCSGQTTTIREIVQAMARVTGRNVTLNNAPTPTATETNAPPTINCLCGDNGKIKGQFGWQPKLTMQDAVRDLVRSFQTSKTSVGA